MLPILLGVLFLLANLLIFARVPTVFTVKNVSGTISLLLILVSVFISLSLIIYGLAARRNEGTGEGRGRHLRTIGVPLLLALLAPLFTLWGLQVNKTTAERGASSNKPCIEVYEKAAAIAKDNPRFRMLDTDRDDTPRFSWYLHWKLPEPRLAALREADQWRTLVRAYLAGTSLMDAQIGRLDRVIKR